MSGSRHSHRGSRSPLYFSTCGSAEDSANPAWEFLRFELGGEAEGAAEATRVQQQAEPVAASDKSRRRGVQLARPPAGVIEQARDLGVVRLVREQVAAVSQQWPQVL